MLFILFSQAVMLLSKEKIQWTISSEVQYDVTHTNKRHCNRTDYKKCNPEKSKPDHSISHHDMRVISEICK